MSTKQKISDKSYDLEMVEIFRKEALSLTPSRMRKYQDVLEKGSGEELIYALGMAENGKLTSDGLLFFSPNLQQTHSGATVRISRPTTGDIEEVDGCLMRQVVETEEFLFDKFDNREPVEEGLKKYHRSLYPRKALREILMNAICHKDYKEQVPVQVKVHNHFLEISNPGPLPKGWDEGNLLKRHRSHPRNRVILNTFYKCFYVEHVGDGIKNILDDCKESGVFPPIFDPDPSGMSVELYFNVKGWLTEKGFDKNYYRMIVEHVLKSGSVSNKEVQELTGLEERQSTKYLNDLIGKNDLIGILEKQGLKGRGVKYILKKDLFDGE
jgi:predicted HTH transcriptional regulator